MPDYEIIDAHERPSPASLVPSPTSTTLGTRDSGLGTATPPSLPRPEPRSPGGIAIRVATLEGGRDVAFIDALQKKHSRMVGWFPTSQLEAYIKGGHVLVAEAATGGPESRVPGPALMHHSHLGLGTRDAGQRAGEPVGYVIAKDRYSGRDDVGIVYQLNVAPGSQRGLVGASLIRAVFERAAYGCRLFCCWCAQDLEANSFWESMGFVPLAFRAGSRSKDRIHIFWQRRVRLNDRETPWWYPSQTRNGAVREDRLVLPIPPGTTWRDAKPRLYPDLPPSPPSPAAEEPRRLPAPRSGATPRPSPAKKMAVVRSRSRHLQGLPAGKAAVITSGGIRYVERAEEAETPEATPAREKKQRGKCDPAQVAFARELRDRYLEHVNTPEGAALLPHAGRYDIGRSVEPGALPGALPGVLPGVPPGAGTLTPPPSLPPLLPAA